MEPGEGIATALARELHEELGIDIGTAYPWVVRIFDYPHALVRLHFFRVFGWRGEFRAREHQNFGFFSTSVLPERAPVAGDRPGFAMACAGSDLCDQCGRAARSRVFLRRLESALARGLKLLQFREPASR